jgi:hypothetical protein
VYQAPCSRRAEVLVVSIQKGEDPFHSHPLAICPERGLADGIGILDNLGMGERESPFGRLEDELDERPLLDNRELLFLLIGFPNTAFPVYASV